ncbi:MAG: adenylosuccinate synthase [Planctomycetota bacterium]|nr:adenylosuccinate synthase [Planctomycetota bacterium]
MPGSATPAALPAAHRVVLGLQWGDEGKGKIIDVLAAHCDLVVRCQGGANAGHTVVVGGRKTVLHLLPSGILHPHVRCLIGHGVVLDPVALGHELDELAAGGCDIAGRLLISERAHLVLPTHPLLDRAYEAARGAGKVGTTLRGIGPCYADKALRTGIRAGDLVDLPAVERAVRARIAHANALAQAWGVEPLDADAALASWLPAAQRIAPLVGDAIAALHAAVDAGQRVLFEGAQGVQLDIDVGTYPFVTSSNTGIGGVLTGTGISHRQIGEVIGVIKAYTTRVGSGPFVTELADERGERLRQRGQEFGATTGRPRRCGWLDLVAVRQACRLNGVDALALTKLDILDGEPELALCVAYRLDGRELNAPPARCADLERVQPVYEVLPGWQRPVSGARGVADLPEAARAYIARIERFLAVPVRWIGTGAARDALIERAP